MQHQIGFSILFFVALTTSSVTAQSCFELWIDPQGPTYCNIASDGSGGRQALVRPLLAEDVGQLYASFSDPPPATPAQDDIHLVAGMPLIVALPQLQHLPSGANVSVAHTLIGEMINLNASIHFLDFITATYYGPHEYLHPLGSLDPGNYRLNLDLSLTANTGIVGPPRVLGYIDFIVHPVPEPPAVALICVTVLIALVSNCGLQVAHDFVFGNYDLERSTHARWSSTGRAWLAGLWCGEGLSLSSQTGE
jgi:hypothetical protein